MAADADELKSLMLEIGLDSELVEQLDPAAPLAGQGVDSVDCPAFAIAIERRYSKVISDEDSLRLRSINDYIAFVNS